MSRVLIVDDESSCLERARAQLASMSNLKISVTTSASTALRHVEQHPATLVVTDLHMPEMDGMQLLAAVRAASPLAPVIVMTAHGSEQVAVEALMAGASGYVSKRMLDQQLVPIVQKVLNSVAARNGRQRLEQVLDFTETRFVFGNENELAQSIIGYLQEKASRLLRFSDNELLRIGLALDEAITNAIYHGNLEVGSELRESGRSGSGEYHALADQRRSQPPFDGRKVYVIGRVSSEAFECVVRDEGRGFRVDAVPDPIAEENLERPSGRGLLLIRQFMDEVRHNDIANEITMVKRAGNVQ